MNRIVTEGYRASIVEALTIIPERIVERLRFVNFLTDTSPTWVGLHSFTDTGDGRNYISTAHCAYPWHTSDRSTTIVLPAEERDRFVEDPSLMVHELGHALDYSLGFEHSARAITPYAAVDRYEAFAESFRGWLYCHGDQDVLMRDEATLALFASLS